MQLSQTQFDESPVLASQIWTICYYTSQSRRYPA